ncbi:MAG: hypothetical protein D6B28_02935 [Gammaproteobacteria bacterium]|nr:MAG: hypothetical protein D6B28_02935 [Gammaproteobacteria bacterium]
MNIILFPKLFIIVAIFILSGCSGAFSSRKHPAKVEDAGSVAMVNRKTTVNRKPVRGSKAVIELMKKAQAQSNAGDNNAAATTIERALRIEPNNPALWHNFALIKYRQGDCKSAINMAKKSNRHAAKGHELIQKNSQIIGECRR